MPYRNSLSKISGISDSLSICFERHLVNLCEKCTIIGPPWWLEKSSFHCSEIYLLLSWTSWTFPFLGAWMNQLQAAYHSSPCYLHTLLFVSVPLRKWFAKEDNLIVQLWSDQCRVQWSHCLLWSLIYTSINKAPTCLTFLADAFLRLWSM